MKTHKRFLAMLLAAVMTLALVACGGDTNPGTDTPNTDAPGDTTTPDSDTNDPAAPAEPNAGEEIKNLVLTDTGELTTLFRPHAEGATEDHIIRNLVVNLLEFDNHGKLQPSAAESWGTEDGGQTWTFKLRDDVTWVDVNGSYKADVAAGMSNEQMWYSGAYTLTTYISSNEKVLTRNLAYFDKDCTRFDTVAIRVVESALVDDQPLKPGLHLQGLRVL